ncbi:uncharacterized protein LACBIDRAFT_303499 [Laccaria bicolor S238N-H82]|uniref:Predicted protein n=1 Tax=Laccaria bicolor (strain S238N-H82 / ATCC MYA-4686) TaxID=486041 RepID=B0DJL2_LACBS|nr:uncharacterized protein LACBIDRAFT_303499 [Laccaria bicolor S238N-H82]EDR05138.1 predicted protein [Laccaria bicolor S238N-H82]|eukprot:XP_001884103.1 predicted protein [Laccaria bicolor S238N-H82]
MLRSEGHGDLRGGMCMLCRGPCGVFRCDDCLGGRLECSGCCLARHKDLPLHIIQKWNNVYFQKISLKLLQCDWFPATVYQPQTCPTFQLLDLFHIVTLTGKLSTHEVYKSLEHLTDNLDINVPKTRYRALMRMIRMWHHLKLMKHAGRGNFANGLINTQSGHLAVACPACPMPDVNIPEGWKDAPQELKSVSPCLFKMSFSANIRSGPYHFYHKTLATASTTIC